MGSNFANYRGQSALFPIQKGYDFNLDEGAMMIVFGIVGMMKLMLNRLEAREWVAKDPHPRRVDEGV